MSIPVLEKIINVALKALQKVVGATYSFDVDNITGTFRLEVYVTDHHKNYVFSVEGNRNIPLNISNTGLVIQRLATIGIPDNLSQYSNNCTSRKREH
jgi:hypothetical protein